MEPTTDRFLPEIRKSHTVVSYVDVISPVQETFRLPAIGGAVQVDGTADVRRRCTVSCIDTDGTFTPTGVSSVLTPYGTEIRPYRGVKYGDGTEEVVPLGVFRLSKVNVKDTVGGSPTIDMEASDYSRTVSRDRFTVPYTIETGTNLIDAIQAIIERTFPNPDYDILSTTLTTTAPKLFDAGDDPWGACQTLAASMGCDVFFNTVGGVTIAPPVDIDALPTPDFTYIEGDNCTMLDLERVFSDEPGFNGVIVVGESPGDELPPVRGEAWDDEPSSATYRLGPYGEVPMFVTDQNVKTTEEAEAMAEALLRKQLGFSSQVSISAIVNPALDAGDVLEVQRQRSHVEGLFALDAFNIPFAANASQSLTLRQKRVVG